MRWQDAEKIIGRKMDDDYVLDLDSHERRYRETAPALSELMVSATARATAKSYWQFDAAAIAAGKSYKRAMTCTNVGAMLTSMFGAAAMAWTILAANEGIFQSLSFGASILSALAAIAAAAAAAGLYWLRHGRLLENWMGKRAEAETQRVSYFTHLIAQAAKGTTETALLGLEYFRRYHFDIQQDYYFTRARKHEKSAAVTLAIGALGAFVATLSSFVAVTADGSQQAISAVGVFGASIGAYAIGREQMTQDSRNAERYDRTNSALVLITSKLDAVRAAAEQGQTGAIVPFVEAVNELVSNEHRQWLEEQEATKEALDRIESALSSANSADQEA